MLREGQFFFFLPILLVVYNTKGEIRDIQLF